MRPGRRGAVVLTFDATHFYANIRNRDPFPVVVNVGDMQEACETVERLADSPDHVIPGHDPEVMRLYLRVEQGPGVSRRSPCAGRRWYLDQGLGGSQMCRQPCPAVLDFG